MSGTVESIYKRVREAAPRLSDYVVRTPLQHSASFSELLGANVYFKLENLQTTGSFKLRGASNRVLALSEAERDKGCVAASSGNHGAAVACALQQLGISGVIFVPEKTSAVKVDAIRHYGGDVRFFGTDGLDTEQHARQYADDNAMTYLSPYNDLDVVAGQGSCGIEIVEQIKSIDDVFIAVGGGGLIAGVGSVIRVRFPDAKVYACQPRASAVMAHSVAAGKLLDIASEPTLSDGTAGGIEPGAITFEMVQQVVDEFVLVEEEEIAAAMRLYVAHEDHSIEGAAGVAIAALLKMAAAIRARNAVVIICGGNIEAQKLADIVASD